MSPRLQDLSRRTRSKLKKKFKIEKFDNIEFNFIEQYLSLIFLFVISPQKPTFRPSYHPFLR